MDHLLVHTVEIIDNVLSGDEEGTPTYSEQVVWTGPGRLNTPRLSSDFPPGASPRKVLRSTVFLPSTCPVTNSSRVRVSSRERTSNWKVCGFGEAEGFFSGHHVEVKVEALEES